MATPTQPSLAELLTTLEVAVRDRNYALAVEIERIIQQRLAIDAADSAALERRVRALMTELEAPVAEEPIDPNFNPLNLEKSGPDAEAEHVVYPVWFGTNRKAMPRGGGFTGERHDRITLGRVDVHVPLAHRFSETGTGFWKRLLRFDLRDDRLRIHHVETQERNAFFGEIREAM
jgi:hypothetical protein